MKLTDRPNLETMRAFTFIVHRAYGPIVGWEHRPVEGWTWEELIDSLVSYLTREDMRFLSDSNSEMEARNGNYRNLNRLLARGQPRVLPEELKLAAAYAVCSQALGWGDHA